MMRQLAGMKHIIMVKYSIMVRDSWDAKDI